MTGVLAIETATDACSVAVLLDGQIVQRHEVAARRHSQRLFEMLRELLPSGNLRAQGIELVAYGSGPGSFTGLRIAASAVQGLAFAADLPAVPVSTLACLATTAQRALDISEEAYILSLLDARINEVYYALYRCSGGHVIEACAPRACAPEEVEVDASIQGIRAFGSGCNFSERLPETLRSRLLSVNADLLPEARDLISPALEKFRRGQFQAPGQVQPVYVREEISWKKIPEQGKRG